MRHRYRGKVPVGDKTRFHRFKATTGGYLVIEGVIDKDIIADVDKYI